MLTRRSASETSPQSQSTQQLAKLLDGAIARAFRVLPLAVEDRVLHLGCANTGAGATARTLSVLCDMEVRLVRMSESEIRAGQAELYPGEPAPPPPAEHDRAERPGDRPPTVAGLPLVSLKQRADGSDPVDHEAARLLDEGFCWHFGVIALASHNGVVVIATANPEDMAATRAAALMAGGEPLVLAAARGEVEQALGRVFARSSHAVPAPRRLVRHPARMRLGEMLLMAGAIDHEQLAAALRSQQQTGDSLGAVLLHSGAIDEQQLIDTLGEQLGLDSVRIDPSRLDEAALALLPRQLIVRHHVVPLAVQDGQVVLAMVDPLDEDTLAALAEHLTLPPRPVLACDSDIDRAIQAIAAQERVLAASSELARRMPAQSAERVLSGGQKAVFGGLCVAAVVALCINPIAAIVAFNVGSVLFYAAFSIYRLRLIYRAVAHKLEFPVSDGEVAALDERTLPVYTILVPLYREAAVLEQLIRALCELDYPATRLDIKLLVEQDDSETLEALRALQPPPHFRLVVVPHSEPRTKPKACNYGLAQARGEYVVIYDAEDRPEPDQLKKAIVAFRKVPDEVACVQCKLNYYNREQNLLTRWFTTEYSMWFDIYMPGLDAVGAPIPLGGTSNHFLAARLSELGAWDPHNVAEDADLGVRLARAGYRTAMIDSTTFEEAASDIANWTRQRSRWVKGYIQTWLVHMRQPLLLARQMGPRRWLSFQMTVAGTFVSFLMNPVYWTLNTVWAFSEAGVIRQMFPPLIAYAAACSLILGNFAFTYVVAAGAMRRRYFSLVKYALLSPVYWGLMSIGAWKGFLQLFTRPSFWEKTTHGLDGSA